ncbi:unnamed protein product [Soboliphyme baturini]|uniref:Uncharacterized protein n=1 Tax=Soboliphyme baturini TaxID=241478 RepID=A0A183IY41_9BILA|nr:unnamed protein product [Soboliphyme baturini]
MFEEIGFELTPKKRQKLSISSSPEEIEFGHWRQNRTQKHVASKEAMTFATVANVVASRASASEGHLQPYVEAVEPTPPNNRKRGRFKMGTERANTNDQNDRSAKWKDESTANEMTGCA